jgi:hypothetical protein
VYNNFNFRFGTFNKVVGFVSELSNVIVFDIVSRVLITVEGFVIIDTLSVLPEIVAITCVALMIESVSQPLKQHLFGSSFFEYEHPPVIPQYPYCNLKLLMRTI